MRTTQQIANELTNKKALEQIARYMAKNNDNLFTSMEKKRVVMAYLNTIIETLILFIGVGIFICVLSLLGA